MQEKYLFHRVVWSLNDIIFNISISKIRYQNRYYHYMQIILTTMSVLWKLKSHVDFLGQETSEFA